MIRTLLIVSAVVISVIIGVILCAVLGDVFWNNRHVIIPVYTLLVFITSWFATAPRQYTSKELCTDVCPGCQYKMEDEVGCAIGYHPSICTYKNGVTIDTIE